MGMILAAALLMVSAAYAGSAVDVIMATGTTQAFTDEAASTKEYGVKIVSSPARTLNGENHDALCEKLGVDPSMQAVAVLLIGKPDTGVDGASGATTRDPYETKTSIIE